MKDNNFVSRIKEIDYKEHKFLLGGVAALVGLFIIGNIIGLVFHAKMQSAANDYDAMNKAVAGVVQEERISRTIRYVANHNDGAVDLTQTISNTNDGITAPFTLECTPGDVLDSPEYHNRRIASDTAFIKDWVMPVFTYSGLDDYFTNYQTMQDRFTAACATSPDMAGCKTQFFLYVMPDCSDLNVTVQDPTERARYNGMMNFGNVYCLNANFEAAPYTYTYLAEVSMTSQNPSNRSTGNPNGATEANFCIIYTIERTADGVPVLRNIRFSSLQGITLQ